MPRPVRNKKPVNYSQSLDSDIEDDDDFVPWTTASNKKSKISKERKQEKEEKSKTKNRHKEEPPLQVKTPNKRMALDDKLYKRDLEVALALSVKEPSIATTEMQKSPDVEKCDIAESEKMSISPHLSNCSIDGVSFNLNKITEEDDSQAGHRQRKAASQAMIQQKKLLRENSEEDNATDSEPDFTANLNKITEEDDSHAGHRQRKAASKAMIQQRKLLRENSEGDNIIDSEPDFTASESNSNFSESAGEDDEDFTIRKNKAKENKKKNAKTKAPVEKKKKASKTSNSLVPGVSDLAPVESKPAPKEACLSSKLVQKPLQSLSPLTECKRPRWVPPASSGGSSNPLGGVSVRSPSHSLRLGLSRFARVKPLHPTASST
ncbi:RAD51-associated protein 1 isoform X2 [Gracilinanus agilis]|uniref:RAD51-associated protein 1 isoform X2 n=1 Tax=Gracilinanus agilis TaxID=191870 RepID=UPI001CFD53F6|nr:RAD51-associated protein 1 isoform X2 [Gracilinanus agilis]